jgi:hypothetical protein
MKSKVEDKNSHSTKNDQFIWSFFVCLNVVVRRFAPKHPGSKCFKILVLKPRFFSENDDTRQSDVVLFGHEPINLVWDISHLLVLVRPNLFQERDILAKPETSIPWQGFYS